MSLLLTIYKASRYGFARVHSIILLGIYRNALKSCGCKFLIREQAYIRNPECVNFGDFCEVGFGSIIFTEKEDSYCIIGSNVKLNAKVTLDYTGNLEIEDHVLISAGAIIYSHHHGFDPKSNPTPIKKVIKTNSWIGVNAIILSSCEIIGENSIVGAGSVVTKNVPSNCVVAGNPAKVIRKLVSSE